MDPELGADLTQRDQATVHPGSGEPPVRAHPHGERSIEAGPDEVDVVAVGVEARLENHVRSMSTFDRVGDQRHEVSLT